MATRNAAAVMAPAPAPGFRKHANLNPRRLSLELLRITRRQPSEWSRQGLIPSFRLGRAVRFRPSEVAAALERHRSG
jgi:excisionase family DNA binding protein